MRAIIKLLDDDYVNIAADTIEKNDEWIVVCNNGKTVGLFDEGNIKCAYLSDKKGEKNDLRKVSADKN